MDYTPLIDAFYEDYPEHARDIFFAVYGAQDPFEETQNAPRIYGDLSLYSKTEGETQIFSTVCDATMCTRHTCVDNKGRPGVFCIVHLHDDFSACDYTSLPMQSPLPEKALRRIEGGFIFNHEVAHALMARRAPVEIPDTANKKHFGENVSDGYAALRAIQEHGLAGLDYARYVADLRQLAQASRIDCVHYTTLTLDQAAVFAMKTGLHTLKEFSSHELYFAARRIAASNTMTNRQLDALRFAYSAFMAEPERDLSGLPASLHNRFKHAVHRRVRGRFGNSAGEIAALNGPWSSAGAKFKSESCLSPADEAVPGAQEQTALMVRFFTRACRSYQTGPGIEMRRVLDYIAWHDPKLVKFLIGVLDIFHHYDVPAFERAYGGPEGSALLAQKYHTPDDERARLIRMNSAPRPPVAAFMAG